MHRFFRSETTKIWVNLVEKITNSYTRAEEKDNKVAGNGDSGHMELLRQISALVQCFFHIRLDITWLTDVNSMGSCGKTAAFHPCHVAIIQGETLEITPFFPVLLWNALLLHSCDDECRPACS